MGTDIHTIAQVKQNGIWIDNPIKVFPNPMHNQTSEFEINPEGSRNYDWFAVIADVRNGRGFAGVRTSDGFNTISDPRGLPEGFNEDREEYIGDHSFSYVTLEDFDRFDWNQVSLKSGIISIDSYRSLKGTNECPDTYCGGISGPNIIVLSEEEADCTSAYFDPETKYYVQYNWTIIYREWFGYKIENWVDPMRKLKDRFEDVRIVFGFDS